MKKDSLVHFVVGSYIVRRATALFFAALSFVAAQEGWTTYLWGAGILLVACAITAIPWVIDWWRDEL